MFNNREEAGLLLAEKLKEKKIGKDTIVVAIPRGGVVVGKVISEKLNLRLLAIVVKKIAAPNNPELAIGAVGSTGVVQWNEEIIAELEINEEMRKQLKEKKQTEIKEREEFLGINIPVLNGEQAIIVDDGVATGSTVRVAAKILKGSNSGKVILATPVISKDIYDNFKEEFNDIIFLLKSNNFRAVGEFYKEFPQIEDGEVKHILNSNLK